jgi:colanic acid/amylovoran biosynthesis protein
MVRRTEQRPVDILAHAFFLPWTRTQYGLVSARDVDVILDCSGFAYGDEWGPYRARRTGKLLPYWKRTGKKLILLPQALGPFAGQEIRDRFGEVLDYASLICPRDKASLEHLLSFDIDPKRICQAPDFTNQVAGVVPDGFEADSDRVAVIPNKRMLDKTHPLTAAAYKPFVCECLQHIKKLGLRPSIIVHEVNELDFARNLSESVPFEVDVIDEPDAILLKGIIGTCRAVVSSRFHGAVSALSQSVPCVATGWTHKYRMLLEDYGCPELLVEDVTFLDEVRATIESACCGASRESIIATLRDSFDRLKQATRDMWARVDAELGLPA